jgi:hypothetical protein
MPHHRNVTAPRSSADVASQKRCDAIRFSSRWIPLDERDDLPVRLVFARLLDAGVEVADDRLHLADVLALQRAQQAQHAVGGGMVRPEVDREQLLLRLALASLATAPYGR